jgi:hypothetical protein
LASHQPDIPLIALGRTPPEPPSAGGVVLARRACHNTTWLGLTRIGLPGAANATLISGHRASGDRREDDSAT